jgi:hypothetical protein
MPSVYDYLLLRFVPDPARGEALNAGVVAFTPNGPIVRLEADVKRLRALHPDLATLDFSDWASRITDQLGMFKDREQQMTWLAHGLAPLVADRALGQIAAEPGADLENAIEQLLTRWVRVPSRTGKGPKRAPATSRLHGEVRAWLRRAKLFSPKLSDIGNRRVVPNFPISIADDLFAEFAMRNSATHIVETLDLRGVERLTKARHGEVGLKAVLLDQARAVTSEKGQRVLLTAADDYGAVKTAIHLLHKYADHVYAKESAADSQAFADFMARSLHSDLVALPLLPP